MAKIRINKLIQHIKWQLFLVIVAIFFGKWDGFDHLHSVFIKSLRSTAFLKAVLGGGVWGDGFPPQRFKKGGFSG